VILNSFVLENSTLFSTGTASPFVLQSASGILLQAARDQNIVLTTAGTMRVLLL
jgi:hypothetical protein